MGADQKWEVIDLVRRSPLSKARTLEELGIARSAFGARVPGDGSKSAWLLVRECKTGLFSKPPAESSVDHFNRHDEYEGSEENP
jgi:hypothetical protein